jgi:predicted nucleic acid-binding Zn ribbon protein
MASRFNPPALLAGLLKQALEKWNLSSTLTRYELMGEWESIVGNKTASKSRPTKYQGELLIVEVDHPAWVQELNLLKGQILKKISQTYPKSGIKNIRFILK